MFKKIFCVSIVFFLFLTGCKSNNIVGGDSLNESENIEAIDENIDIPDDLNSEQLIDLLNESRKYFDLLFGSGCNYVDYNDKTISNGNEYYKVTFNGTSNVNEIKNMILQLYTEEAVDNGLKLDDSDHPKYIVLDGDLYSCGLGIGGVGREIIRLEAVRVNDFEYSLDISLAKMKFDTEEYDYDNPMIEHYAMYYIDGAWKFNENVNIGEDSWGKCSVSISKDDYSSKEIKSETANINIDNQKSDANNQMNINDYSNTILHLPWGIDTNEAIEYASTHFAADNFTKSKITDNESQIKFFINNYEGMNGVTVEATFNFTNDKMYFVAFAFKIEPNCEYNMKDIIDIQLEKYNITDNDIATPYMNNGDLETLYERKTDNGYFDINIYKDGGFTILCDDGITFGN